MAALLNYFGLALKTFEARVCCSFRNLQWALQPRDEELRPAFDTCGFKQPGGDINENDEEETKAKSALEDLIGNGFLWAVPKFRRTVEQRRIRWLAVERRLKPKRNLMSCKTCGHFHEAHTVCGNCYEKVRAETLAIQEAINGEWKCDAIDKDVAVVYENDPKNEEFWGGKRIVEIARERPQWFHPNLQQRTNPASNATTSTTLHPSRSILTQVK